MAFDNAPRDEKTKPRTSVLPLRRWPNLSKRLEQLIHVFRRNAPSGIQDRKLNLAVLFVQFNRNISAGGGKLQGV